MTGIRKIISLIFFIFFCFYDIAYCIDKKEEMKQYLGKLDPILINVQITSRNISQKLLTLEAGIKQMQTCLDSLRSLVPPEFMAKQHKMILLSLKKMRMGFYVLLHGDRPGSISLVRRGADLLRIAVKDIVDFGKKEGLIKEKEGVEHK